MEINQILEPILWDVVKFYLIPKYDSLGMRASGEWARTLEVRGNEIWGRSYTEFMVGGRPPNVDQDEESIMRFVRWAGSTFLKDWVEDKGLNMNPYAVAFKIATEGTRSYPEGTDLLEELESPEVREFIAEQLLKKAIVIIKKDLILDINLMFAR